MSPANDESWGEELLTEALLDGESGVTQMTFTTDTLVWDLLAADAEGTTITFMGIDFSNAPTEGTKLTLGQEDGGFFVFCQKITCRFCM